MILAFSVSLVNPNVLQFTRMWCFYLSNFTALKTHSSITRENVSGPFRMKIVYVTLGKTTRIVSEGQ